MDQSIFEIIDAADDRGRYRFTAYTLRLPKESADGAQPAGSQKPFKFAREDIKAAIEYGAFSGCHLALIARLDSKSVWKEVDVRVVGWQDGCARLDLNLCKMFSLPGVSPKAELAELKRLLEAMKPFFESNWERRCMVQIVNEHRPLRGKVLCNVPDPNGSGFMKSDAAHSERLHSVIEQSPVLKQWLDSVARSLNKFGPYSWMYVTENDLYGERLGPWYTKTFRPEQERLMQAKRDDQNQPARVAKRPRP
jgi:hypothetical protein